VNDVESRLARLGSAPEPSVTDRQVAADLLAGRRASRDRRARRASLAAAGLVGVAAAAAVVVSVAVQHPATPAPAASGGIRLVDYTGEQQPGFTVTSIPQGYVLQGASRGILAIALPDDHSSIDGFEHKIVVTVAEASEYPAPAGDPVTINGNPGAIETAGDGTTTLEWTLGDRLVDVQMWRDIDLTSDQLVTFADGITVTSAAQDSHG
jgi:hypothetical protein